jgi:hypothetical protein
MDNSFFILSKQPVVVSRFHICTWDIENENSFIEFGIEFNSLERINRANTKERNFKLVVPFMGKGDPVICLSSRLVENTDSCKFIFNDNVKNVSPIRDDKRNGSVLEFGDRGTLSVLPLVDEAVHKENQIISFSVATLDLSESHPNYIRFLVKPQKSTLATVIKGIAYKDFIYDIKLNEKRNLPNHVHEILRKEYTLCTVNQCFCFHVVPNSFTIAFVDQKKLKSVRELEVMAFKKFLPEIHSMEENKHIIVFNKDSKSNDSKTLESYSFFTIFNKEIIGAKQIMIAIAINIICSLFFAFVTLKTLPVPSIYWFIFFALLGIVILLSLKWGKRKK